MPKEQARVRKVLGLYKELGKEGVLGASLIEQSLKFADQAVMSGDCIEMIKAYEDLKSIE